MIELKLEKKGFIPSPVTQVPVARVTSLLLS